MTTTLFVHKNDPIRKQVKGYIDKINQYVLSKASLKPFVGAMQTIFATTKFQLPEESCPELQGEIQAINNENYETI